MSDLPRRHRGTPIGGQFAEDRKPSDVDLIEVKLTDNKSYNSQGSAIHPPLPRDARQVLEFWTNVDMPDHLLNNIAVADLAVGVGGARLYYKDAVKEHKERLKDIHRPAWRRKNHYNEADVPGLQNLLSQQFQAIQEGPRAIPPEELQQVSRMAHVFVQARSLPKEEGDKCRDAVFSFGTETKTPRQVWNQYTLWEIEPALFERTKYRLLLPAQQ